MRGSTNDLKVLLSSAVLFSFVLLSPLFYSFVSAQEDDLPYDEEYFRRRYELDFEGDASGIGISNVLENDLIPSINLTQTIKDVTVHIYWAYADEYKVLIRYYVLAPQYDVAKQLLKDLPVLTLPDGTKPSEMGFGEQTDPFAPKDALSAQYTYVLPEDYAYKGDEIPLIFEINPSGAALETYFAKAGIILPESSAEPTAEVDENATHTFRFKFTVPFYKAIKLDFDIDQAIDSHDEVTLKITDIAVTPTSLYVTTCIETPRYGAWQAKAAESTVNDFYLLGVDTGFNDGCFNKPTDFYWQEEPLNIHMMIQDIVEQPLVEVFAKMPENDFRFVMKELKDRGGFLELTDDRRIIGFGSEVAEVLADYGYAEHFDGTWEVNFTATAPQDEE